MHEVEISTSGTAGAWIKHKSGDVHVCLEQGQIVIGTNKSYKDKIQFTDLCLVIGTERCYLQYEKNGKAEQVDVPVSIVKDRILGMLGEVKADMVVND